MDVSTRSEKSQGSKSKISQNPSLTSLIHLKNVNWCILISNIYLMQCWVAKAGTFTSTNQQISLTKIPVDFCHKLNYNENFVLWSMSQVNVLHYAEVCIGMKWGKDWTVPSPLYIQKDFWKPSYTEQFEYIFLMLQPRKKNVLMCLLLISFGAREGEWQKPWG